MIRMTKWSGWFSHFSTRYSHNYINYRCDCFENFLEEYVETNNFQSDRRIMNQNRLIQVSST